MFIIFKIIKFINKIMQSINSLYGYREYYKIGGIFFTRKFKKTESYHKYAVLIAARNEEKVICNLIDSIKSQDYPQELVEIFVVADNCTDKTAEIARKNGANCYERFDDKKRQKDTLYNIWLSV